MNNSTQTLSINQTSSTLYFKTDLKSFVQTDGGIVDRCNGRTEIVFKGPKSYNSCNKRIT